jgi:23S rRNA pseudouridine1911/1915/1917 synthase
VWGEPQPRAGRIETLIARHPTSRTKMAVVKAGGRIAATNYETVHTYRVPSVADKGKGSNAIALSAVSCSLETGRTHQVRVHMAHIGTPIVCDGVYGAGFASKAQALPAQLAGALERLGRQALHAAVLRFRHPVTRKVLAFESNLPGEIADLCETFETLVTKLSKN